MNVKNGNALPNPGAGNWWDAKGKTPRPINGRRRTERMIATTELDGGTQRTAAISLERVLASLDLAAYESGREVLYDTLKVSIDRKLREEQTLTGRVDYFITDTIVTASAECLLHEVSETNNNEKE